jgi:transposase
MVAENAEQVSKTEFIRLLAQANPLIASARAVILESLCGLREKYAGMLKAWFADLTLNVDLGDLRAFAVGLVRDQKALKVALSLPWSHGPTEGAVTRIKLIKRQGYGRAVLRF